MTREIPLTRGLVALVDDEDYERAMEVKWHARVSAHTAYGVRTVPRGGGRHGSLFLHTFLTGWPLVDHRNGNGLDNRRENLRPATAVENLRNRRLAPANTSGFKGVSRKGDKWRASIGVDGGHVHLGCFSTREDAAHAYDAAAREHFREYAALNFPGPGERSAHLTASEIGAAS